ncbi:hypothetical protein LZ318_13535 [Saccharopolyspora indica]|uniref:hypothetical protein n=1 Tax=Saccharopolyspora indica TaxID=1229659 RepID=UPI0022EAA138|nr:hypothetical protein [Saccharopolyspora indica]MDA3647081.1 hypothetical protein [Saccharopolyspora indica]
MSAKTTRRIGAIAGLALLPALVFGGTAVAASAETQPANGNPSQTRPVNPPDQHEIKVAGEVSKIEKRGDLEWGEVTVVSVVAHPGSPELDFVLTPQTVVELENGAPEVGTKVTAAGEVQQDGETVLADHVVFH